MRVLPSDATYASRCLKLSSSQTETVAPSKYYQVDANGNKVELKETKFSTAVLVSSEDLAAKSINDIIEENKTENGADPVIIIPESASLNYTIDPTVKLYGDKGADRSDGNTEITSMNPSGNVEMFGFSFTGKALAGSFENAEVIQISNSTFENLSQCYASSGTSFNVVEFDASDPETSVEIPEEQEFRVIEEINKEVVKSYNFAEAENLSGFNLVTQMDSAVNDEDADIIFFPYGRGEYYNKIGYKITKAKKSYENSFVFDIYVRQDKTNFNSLVESFIVSFDLNATDSSGASLFIKDVLDNYSEYLRCKVSENIGVYDEETTDTVEDGDVVTITHFSADYDNLAMGKPEFLTGGTDGPMYTKSGALDWKVMEGPMGDAYLGAGDPDTLTGHINPETGEDVSYITDTEDFDVTVIFDAGYPDYVKKNIEALCDARNTCFGILDNGIYYENGCKSAKAAIDRRLSDTNYSNYRLALYEPYTKVYDSYTGKYLWMTPIYHIADLMTKTARDYDIFWAFAGMRRGVVSGVKDYRYRLQGGYRDQFKDNELNPILRFTNGGDLLWGNWTTQQTPSALKNIHVVLCLQYIQRTLEKNLKQYIYEFNDEYTYALIKNSVNNFLSELQAQRALESFSVGVSATDYQKRNNQCQVDINLKVTGVIEIINVSLNVQ